MSREEKIAEGIADLLQECRVLGAAAWPCCVRGCSVWSLHLPSIPLQAIPAEKRHFRIRSDKGLKLSCSDCTKVLPIPIDQASVFI